MEFDSTNNNFTIAENATETYNLGSHTVFVKASYTNKTGHLFEFEREFTLTILPLPVPEKNLTDVYWWDEFNGTIAYGREGFYDPRQPIPFIKHFENTGILRVGWDRSILIPTRYFTIPSE